MKTRHELLACYPWLRLAEPNNDGTVAPAVLYQRLTAYDLRLRAPWLRTAAFPADELAFYAAGGD